jgi:hypothetical protein
MPRVRTKYACRSGRVHEADVSDSRGSRIGSQSTKSSLKFYYEGRFVGCQSKSNLVCIDCSVYLTISFEESAQKYVRIWLIRSQSSGVSVKTFRRVQISSVTCDVRQDQFLCAGTMIRPATSIMPLGDPSSEDVQSDFRENSFQNGEPEIWPAGQPMHYSTRRHPASTPFCRRLAHWKFD